MPYKSKEGASSVVRLQILEIEGRLKVEHTGFDNLILGNGKKWSKPQSQPISPSERPEKVLRKKPVNPAEEQSHSAQETNKRMEEIGKLLEVARQSSYLNESEPSSTASSACTSPMIERRTTIEMVVHTPTSVSCSPAGRHSTKAMRAVELDSYKEQFERTRTKLVAAKERTQKENMQLVEKIQEQVSEEQRQRRIQRMELQRRENRMRDKECEDSRQRTKETLLKSVKSQQQIVQIGEEAEALRRRRRMEEIKKEEERKKERNHRRKMRDMVRVLEDEYEDLKQAQQSHPAYFKRI